LTHSETSTGVMNPLPEICCVLAKYPDVALIVDTVSSFSGVKIDMDALGIDVMLTGAQKALALPPGFSLFSASDKAFERADKVPNRGFYFDFLEFKSEQAQFMTPSTPSIGHVNAVDSKLEDIFAEGLEARYARHRKTNQMTRDWAARHGFTLLPEKGFESITLTCISNGARTEGRTVDVPKLQKMVKDAGFLIDGGYGKIKGTTFRISNMGDETEATMGQLFAAMDDAMKKL
jgi:aspartate aminotransferase-like enzyme